MMTPLQDVDVEQFDDGNGVKCYMLVVRLIQFWNCPLPAALAPMVLATNQPMPDHCLYFVEEF